MKTFMRPALFALLAVSIPAVKAQVLVGSSLLIGNAGSTYPTYSYFETQNSSLLIGVDGGGNSYVYVSGAQAGGSITYGTSAYGSVYFITNGHLAAYLDDFQNATFESSIFVNDFATISGTTDSTSDSTGAAAIAGGVGIGKTLTANHYDSDSPAPSIVAGGGAGSGAIVSISGTDVSGTISLTEGSSPSNIGVATITFARPYATTPKSITITPASPAAAALYGSSQVYAPDVFGIEIVSQYAFYLCTAGGSLTPSTQYKWYYRVN